MTGVATDLEAIGLGSLPDGDEHGEVRRLGFSPIGEGHFATVYARDDLTGVAVRVSTTTDGWLRYAVAILRDDLDSVRFSPRIRDVRPLEGDGYVALVERLRSARTDEEMADVRVAQDLCRNAHDEIDANALEAFRERHPGFQAWIEDLKPMLGKGHIDPSDGNILFDDAGRIVVNDPCGITYSVEDRRVMFEDGLGIEIPRSGLSR